ncbi:unnamed protein product [Kuraishia capsulata CBS 1993]|uniref:Pheromone alpha factor receptor n=1 Tax=Kuraishia capsulata CBS 1993 TaxID=1382522 RepID=W6MJ91_9ASCO|nr:uncharacterized protein KUCA_T00001984001 [Kuraishia capsulata CBS 1993]CDK26013.1 unnamed protein product [Kuraishia capsulata CBS 1993]
MDKIDFALPAGLNPEDILLNYTSPYGNTSIAFGDLDSWFRNELATAAVFGARISVSAMTIVVSWIVSKNRRAPIFIVNQLALLSISIHSGLYLRFLNGVYGSIAFNFSLYDYTNHDATVTSVVTNTFQILVIGFIEASLVLQTYTIFRSPNRMMQVFGIAATVMACLLGLITTGLYFATAVYSNINLTSTSLVATPSWVGAVPLAVFTASFVIVSLMLNVKLFIAIRTRRYLGLKQFDIFHILFIMSSQTMVIPTAIIIASFCTNGKVTYNYLSAIGTLLVATSLPLTTMWANSSIKETTPCSSADTVLYKPMSNSSKSLYMSASRTIVGDKSPGEKPDLSTGDDDDYKNSSWWIEANLEAAENGYGEGEDNDDFLRKITTTRGTNA